MRHHKVLWLFLTFSSLNVQAEDVPQFKQWTPPGDPFYKELKSIPEGSCTEPKYTETPRSLEEVGMVQVRYEISAEGKTKSVSVVGESSMLKSLTYRYLSGCKFPPTILAGKPVSAQIVVPVEWKLNGVSNPTIQMEGACRPKYPVDAEMRKARGTTKLIVSVSETSEIIDVSVLSSSSHTDLDQAAVNAVRHCKAVAGTSDGKPKNKKTIVAVDWRLAD